MILHILEILNNFKINEKKKSNNKLVNTEFDYNYNLLVNKNKMYIKKIISCLNKITSDNYLNIYFSIIEIINDEDVNKNDIISFVYKKIYQNSFYIDTYINFILLNKNLTIEFINYIQNLFENKLEDNIIVIDIICILYKKNIIDMKLYDSILQFLFNNPKNNIDYIIQFYKCNPNEELKNKILQIPKLSFRYRYKLE